MKNISVQTKVTPQGFTTQIDHRKLKTSYPDTIWNAVPKRTKEQIAQTAAYFVTRHVVFLNNARLFYNFPPPAARLFMDYGNFYSIAEAPLEFPEKKLTMPNVLKSAYNAEFAVTFHGIPQPVLGHPFAPNSHAAVMPISFGKDSLLTYALADEIGLSVYPIFVEEPTCPYQNRKKRTLMTSFNKEFSRKIIPFANTLGSLRQARGMMWGWDMLLVQYTVLLLPFVYRTKPVYFFWSNEQSTNEFARTREGYLVNSAHEQNVQWVLHLNNLFRLFAVNTTISSLIEPLHELVILSILHNRYPGVSKYQLSCDGEKTKYRWCGNCFECARIFLFFTALGIDPRRVGLMENMFAANKRHLFYLFGKHGTKQSLDIVFQSYEERLLAFYLVYKRGVKAPLVNEFKKKFLPFVEKHKSTLFKKYFAIHDMHTIPDALQKPLKKIYAEELARLKRNLSV